MGTKTITHMVGPYNSKGRVSLCFNTNAVIITTEPRAVTCKKCLSKMGPSEYPLIGHRPKKSHVRQKITLIQSGAP